MGRLGMRTRRILSTLVALVALLPVYAAHPRVVLGAEAYSYLKDVEIRWRWTSASSWSPWEDPAFAQAYGSTARQMQIWVEVYAEASKTYKIGVYDANAKVWLSTTSMAISAGQTAIWQTQVLTTPVIEQALGVYLYYWNGSAYVNDDVAYGWTGVHSYLQLNGAAISDWAPNGATLPTFVRSADGQYVTVTQYLWWWNNSHYTNQVQGTVRLNRLKSWATRPDSWLWTIEFRREDRPSGAGQGTPLKKEGWDFCPTDWWLPCTYLDWSSNIPGLRTSDVEESHRNNGDEEAQFEVDNEDVNLLRTVTAQKPATTYANQYYLQVQFKRTTNLGQAVWMKTDMELEASPPRLDYEEFLTQTLTSI
jgi:hypothetical protein